jgi:hypothetical protein
MFPLAVEQNAAGSLPSSWHKVGTESHVELSADIVVKVRAFRCQIKIRE